MKRKFLLLCSFLLFPICIFPYAFKPKLPVNIYHEGDIIKEKAYYAPTCWAGDVLAILYEEKCRENPKRGSYCMKFTYNLAAQAVFNWINIFWTFPSYNWGDIDGGLDLTGAKKLIFWARGKRGGEKVIIKFGGNYGVFSDTADILYGPITLKKRWQKYTISLKGEDLTHISLGFALVMRRKDYIKINRKLITIYLDEIKIQ